MRYRILLTRNFEKEAKRLFKKYPSLKTELSLLNKELIANPTLGTPLGRNAYKIRLSVKSKGRGKSGGMRVITFLEVDIIIRDTTNIFLLSIYDKSETSSISNDELKRIISSSKNS